MTIFKAVRSPALIAVVGVLVLLSGCSAGASDADVAQAVKVASEAQAQKDTIKAQQDTQASLSADVTRLKNEAGKAAEAKVAEAKARADSAAAAKAADARVAAAKAATARPERTSCNDNVSVGGNTTCAFAVNVEDTYYQSGGGYSTFWVYSPVTGLYYTMTCTPGVPTVCRGGHNAVVYIR